MSLKYLSLQDRCKGGKLPLKKRRFCMISTDDVDESSSSAVTALASLASASFEVIPQSRLSALSLVASTAPKVSHVSAQDMERRYSSEGDSVAKASVSHDEKEGGEHQANKESTTKRQQVAPLDKPLPGGCHGRTSRNNSYCRRQPCYNGSVYCKLHYQQHVLLSEVTGDLSQGCVPTGQTTAPFLAKTTFKSSSSVPFAGNENGVSASLKKPPSFQDKRYVGNQGEVRCKATTTRGRDCAYVAIDGRKYCHLHADYDNNPPPRRGGGGGGSICSSPKKSLNKDAPELHAASSFSSSDSYTTGNPTKKPKLPSERGRRRTTSSKLAKKHMDSPVPLLSMISTDQWADKLVKISVGPLMDRIGTVERWSNGWVSVRVEGVGLHNRRSFELHLLQQDDQELSRKADHMCVTPSPNIGSLEEPSSVKSVRPTIKFSLNAPVTPSPHGSAGPSSETEWPKTPAMASEETLPFVPSVTPSPRKAALTTTSAFDSASSERLSKGLLLSDSALARGRSDVTLQLRMEAREMGDAPPFPSRSGSKGEKAN